MNQSASLSVSLRGHHLFAGLDPRQFEQVMVASRIDDYEAGQVLFERGQNAQHFFIVLDGQINLFLYSRAGEEKIVEILRPGNSFAEAVMFMEGSAYPVSSVAVVKSQVARLPNREYIAILRESPDTCLRMLSHLSRRLHLRIREIESLTLESATHRLVRLIEARLPPDDDAPAEINLLESRQELASRLSIKPETLSRILRQLVDVGAIDVNGRVLRVNDRKRLIAVRDAIG